MPEIARAMAPFAFFTTYVHNAERLTPRLARITLRSTPDAELTLEHCADYGYDQRIKIAIPIGDHPLPSASRTSLGNLRALPDEVKPAVRTWTLHSVNTDGDAPEATIYVALHGGSGPATCWASAAVEEFENGAPTHRSYLGVIAPDARGEGRYARVDFTPGVTDDLLLLSDETGLPALEKILESLPEHAAGTAFIEVPTVDDILPLAAPSGFEVRYLPRDDAAPSSLLANAALRWKPSAVPLASDESDAPRRRQPTRVWAAGETAALLEIRRHLLGTCGVPRENCVITGHWRYGLAGSDENKDHIRIPP